MMESSNLMVFTYEDLKSLTNDFSHNNLIGVTQFAKLYRGFVKPGFMWSESEGRRSCVTVKIWDDKSNQEYLMEEVEFLGRPSMNGHPNLAKLIGFCSERQVRGVVYDLSPMDTLHNLILKDDLSWIQRINILLQLARLLQFLQDKPYMLLNLSDSHIILDLDYNPKLCDFGLIYNSNNKIPIFIGYGHPYLGVKDVCSDVFSLGVIILGVISKRVFEPEKPISSMIHCWAKREFRPNESLAHKSLREDWGYNHQDGCTVTEIGMRCIEFFPTNRPPMKTVVEHLERLIVLQRLRDNRLNKRHKKLNDSQMLM